MRVILFQDRFAELVRMGVKCQTIRKTARCSPGDVLSLRRWTGKPYRSKQEILKTAVCESVEELFLGMNTLRVGDRTLCPFSQDCFAIDDGFQDMGEMREWFAKTHGLPFDGWLIKWRMGND